MIVQGCICKPGSSHPFPSQALVYSLCPCICASQSQAAVIGSCPHHKQEDRSGSEKGKGH